MTMQPLKDAFTAAERIDDARVVARIAFIQQQQQDRPSDALAALKREQQMQQQIQL